MSNLLLSYELLQLMGWLLKNEQKLMKSLIGKAMSNGLASKIIKMDEDQNSQLNEDTFVDFIAYLEDTLLDGLEDIAMTEEVTENFLPSLNKLDLNEIEANVILKSLKEAEQEPSGKYNSNKELLMEKIFKNWKPKKDTIH